MHCSRECENDIEIVGFTFLLVFGIALLPRLLRTARARRYSDYVGRLRAAPGIVLFTLLWTVAYAAAALAAVVVRIDGGFYTRGNRTPLIEFWLLQLVLAAYFLLFFDWAYLFIGLLPLVIAVVLAFVVATFFLAVRDVAGVLMFVFAGALTALLVLSIAIALNNSDKTVVRATISVTSDSRGGARRGQAQRV